MDLPVTKTFSSISPFLCAAAAGGLGGVVLLHVWVDGLWRRQSGPAGVPRFRGNVVQGSQLPLSGTVNEHGPHAQVVVEQVAVVDQEAQRFLGRGGVSHPNEPTWQRTEVGSR